MITNVESKVMIIAREEVQEKAASKRGCSNRETFGVSDHVRIRDNGSGLWNQKGVVLELVEGEDQIARSYIVLTDDGRKLYQHSTFLHHLVTEEKASTE